MGFETINWIKLKGCEMMAPYSLFGVRLMAKTFSFAILHFGVAFTVAYLLTGSFLIGGLMALIEPACNTVVFYFHEKAWNKMQPTPYVTQVDEHASAFIC
jgi:uncharacterized membrane protein